jgi:hypothetical protein
MTLNEKFSYKNIIEFKNDLLKKMNSLENRVADKIKNNDEDITIKLEEILEKIISSETDIFNLRQISSENQQKYEKIELLDKFKNKAETSLLSHNIRINNIFQEIGEIKLKYDKIFIENLTIPGFVGHSCKYKNLSEYIIHNIKENKKYENENNKIKNDIIAINQKLDNFQKMHIGLLDSICERTNKLIESKIKDVKDIFEKKFEEIMDKIKEIKIKDMENRIDIDKYSKEFKLFTDDFYSFKEHMEKYGINIEQKINKIETNEENNKKIDANNEKILDIKKSFTKYKREIEEIKKLNKEKEEKGNLFEKVILDKINNFEKKKTSEINSLKNIIKQRYNENINNDKNEINLEKKNTNQIKNYKLALNLPLEINNIKRQEKRPLTEMRKTNIFKKENKKEQEKNIISNNLSKNDINKINKNTNKENVLINQEPKKEKEIKNKAEEIDLFGNKLFQKSRNNIKNITQRKKNEDIMFLKKYKVKKNIIKKGSKEIKSISVHMSNKVIADSLLNEENKLINNKEETNMKNNNLTYVSNNYDDKFSQTYLNLSKNKSKTEFSNLYNLSFSGIKGNKAKIKNEFLSPIVDKMYKEYYIKNNLKDFNDINEENTKKQTIKKIVPAFGRTNYESY